MPVILDHPPGLTVTKEGPGSVASSRPSTTHRPGGQPLRWPGRWFLPVDVWRKTSGSSTLSRSQWWVLLSHPAVSQVWPALEPLQALCYTVGSQQPKPPKKTFKGIEH
eukprot:6357182-Amphidinium_carterae.1